MKCCKVLTASTQPHLSLLLQEGYAELDERNKPAKS